MKRNIFFSGILLLAICSLFVFSCDKEPTVGSIQGFVSNSSNSEPIQGANISLSPTGLSTVTGSDGRYEFINLEPGQYSVQAVKSGFESNTKNITIVAGNVSSGDMTMKPEVMDFKLNVDYLDFGTGFSQLKFKIINTSPSLPISYTITESLNWLTVKPSTGNLNAQQEVSVVVDIDRSIIEQSVSSSINVEAAGKTIVLPVNVTISGSDGPNLQLSETALDFGTTATSLAFYVMNTGPQGTSLNWTCSNVNVNWLSLNPTSGNTAGGSSTPVMATIDRTKIDGLVSTSVSVSGAGSTSTITISAASEGSGAAILQLSEGNLNFGESLNSLTFQVKNVGSAGTTLEWTIAEPTVDWLSFTPMSGNTSAGSGTLVTAVVDRNKFHGSVTTSVVVNSQNNNSSLSVSAVNKQPVLYVSTEVVSFGAVSTKQTFTIKNAGDEGTSLKWTIADPSVDWLTVSSQSGTLNAGSSKTITLTVDRDKITDDVNTNLQITAGNQHATVNVTATVGQAEMEVSTTSVDFGNTDNNKTFTIKNTGEEGSTLHWSITDPNLEWLTINPKSGSLTSGQSKTINLSIDRNKFDGSVTATITISSGDQTATVTVYASTAQPVMEVSATTVDFGTLDNSKTFTIQNIGETGSVLSWSISEPSVNWLAVSPSSGNLNANVSSTVNLTIDRTKFTGNVSTTLQITGGGQPVTLTVTAATAIANLVVTPTTVDFGKLSSTKTITVKNTGEEGSVLNWTIPQPTVNWLWVSTLSGNTNANNSVNVTLTIDRSLIEGDVSTSLRVIAGDQTIVVSVSASTASYQLNVTPETVDFGTLANTKSITVKNTGESGSSMAWSLDNIEAEWLTASPTSGTLSANQSRTVTLTLDRTKFEGNVSEILQFFAGTQSAAVTVSAATPEPAMTLSVTSVDFGTLSTTQPITITNSGQDGSVLEWNIESAATWLTVTPTSGSNNANTNTTVNLIVDRNAFVGVQNTTIAITGAGTTINVPVTIDNRVLVVDGLIAYYTFDDGQVTDWSGNYNGTNGGATTSNDIPGTQGYSMDFDGTSSYLQIPYPIFQAGATWSYNLWFKTGYNNCFLFTTNDSGYKITISPTSNLVVRASSNSWSSTNSLTSYLNNQWHMLTITFNGNRYTVYLDGVLFESSNYGYSWFTGYSTTYIGATMTQSSHYFYTGKMDNIRTYNRALTQEEVTVLFNAVQ